MAAQLTPKVPKAKVKANISGTRYIMITHKPQRIKNPLIVGRRPNFLINQIDRMFDGI